MHSIHIRLMWHPQAQFAGYHLAERLDLGRRTGVRIVCEPIRFDDPGIDALIEGRVQMAVLSPCHLLESASPGELRFILAIQQASALVYPARRSSGIRAPRDLAGRRVGVWPGGEDLELRWMLKRSGVDPGAVERLPFNDTAGAFLAGDVDCAQMTVYHELAHVTHALGESEVVALSAGDHGASLIKDGLLARADWLAREPALAQAAIDAILEGWTIAFSDSRRAIEACSAARPDVTPDAHREQLAAIERLALQGATLTHGLGFPDGRHVRDALAALAGLGEHVDARDAAGVADERLWRAAPECWRSRQWPGA